MNERIDAIFQQVLDEDCAEPLHRFAELVRQDEREACAKFVEHEYMRQFEEPWRKNLAAAIRGRTE